MKMNGNSRMQSLIPLAILSIGLSFVSPVSADSYILDINSKTLAPVGTLGQASINAQDINDAGQVVGYFGSRTAAAWHAFITGPNGVDMTDLGTLGGGSSYAYGINDSGQVAGASRTATDSSRAFITGPNGV
jgi:probable HAF family extracellular repeat protein